MSDRDCLNCIHHMPNGCELWNCNFEPSDLIRRTDVLRILDNLYEDAWQSLPGISKSARLSALGYAIDLVKELPEHKGE